MTDIKTLLANAGVEIPEDKKADKEKISFKTEDLRRFFPDSYNTQDIQKSIMQIIEADYRRRQRNRDRGDR